MVDSGTPPAFSILVAAYNAETTLPEALDSLLAQTRTDWEAIVVDDGSTDSTALIAARYAALDPRIRAISQANAGTGSARNTAARSARAGFFALLDADDLYLPEYLERIGRFIDEHPDNDLYSVDGLLLREDGSLAPDDLQPDSEVRHYTAEDLLVRNRIRVHNVFRRSMYDMVGGFDESRSIRNEDYDFWLRALLAHARHIHDPERLKVYRISTTAKTADTMRCYESDIFMFRRLIEGGGLSAQQARIARRTLRGLLRFRKVLIGRDLRAQLEVRLRDRDLAHARSLYLRSHRGWSSTRKYVFGVLLIMVSPRLFARVLPQVTGMSDRGQRPD
jgi:glycosyltransferase involved in cell wall biosynthesis